MKKNKTFLAILLVSALTALISCSKPATTPGNGTNTVTFTAGGTNYSYTSTLGLKGSSSSNSLSFYSYDATGQNTFNFGGGNNASGTYQISSTTGFSVELGSKFYSCQSTTTSGYNGSITVTITGNTATATFNTIIYNPTNVSDSLIITNGRYSGKYTSS